MNNDAKVNELIQGMKEVRIGEVDMSGKVMQQVRNYQYRNQVPRQRRSSGMKLIWTLAGALLLITTATVSAATYFNVNWNGISVKIEPPNTTVDAFVDHSQQPYTQQLEAALANAEEVWKKVTTEEAALYYLSIPLKAADPEYSLEASYGVVPHERDYHVKSADEWWLGGLYEIYSWKGHDIVVRQNLDGEMTRTLQDPHATMSLTFNEGPWESIEMTGDSLARYLPGQLENLLVVKHATVDRKVVTLELRADIAKEQLVRLAELYVNTD
ncbi:hypothetical protein AMS62_24815 [Bacillus sp. FJAT-18019]|nr:hypothetical protein AMS62_24815 [Bacillus sp. FJAT-18019]